MVVLEMSGSSWRVLHYTQSQYIELMGEEKALQVNGIRNAPLVLPEANEAPLFQHLANKRTIDSQLISNSTKDKEGERWELETNVSFKMSNIHAVYKEGINNRKHYVFLSINYAVYHATTQVFSLILAD